MFMPPENQELYDRFYSINRPVFEMIMRDKRHSEDYRKGFSEGVSQARMDLVTALTPPLSIFQKKSITPHGHKNLLDTLLKVIGKIDAFYHLVETTEDTENLYILLSDELRYLEEIIRSDFI